MMAVMCNTGLSSEIYSSTPKDSLTDGGLYTTVNKTNWIFCEDAALNDFAEIG